uniref:uncharacterized protein n=1 Tax=Centroberyx gerrardi TaxID=166262 RepID=UPI003AAD972A
MKYQAGFLKVMCAWMVFLLQSWDAAHVPKKPFEAVTGARCRPKQMTALTKARVNECLTSFDEANGEDLPLWSPGFPELHTPQDSPPLGGKVQCSLLFMAQGLEEVLEDQKNNLNTEDVSLHEKLKDTVSMVNMLAVCVKDVLGGECSPEPPRPKMPKHAFERKKWGHTLLEAARLYLAWLEREVMVQMSKVEVKSNENPKDTEAPVTKYFEGSGYLQQISQ